MRVAHVAFDFRLGYERRDRIDDDQVQRARAREHFRDFEALLTAVRLRHQQAPEVDSDAAIEGGIGGNVRAKATASSMEDEEGERALAMGRLSMDDVTADLAREYKLSPREAEVFGFLAKGRSVPYMRDVLVISKSTIETHIKHIYVKCNVHSKQELLDLVEARQQMRE